MDQQTFDRITAHRHLEALRKIRSITEDRNLSHQQARTIIGEITLAAVAPVNVGDVEKAQAAIDFHPDSSPYWDAPDGQDILRMVNEFGLKSTNTNRERVQLYRDAMREDMEAVS